MTEPRHDEQWMGELRVVRIRRRDYTTGKVTEAVVIGEDGREKWATKHGEPLPLSAVPQVKLKHCGDCAPEGSGFRCTGACNAEPEGERHDDR
jgi:hypothetical protein